MSFKTSFGGYWFLEGDISWILLNELYLVEEKGGKFLSVLVRLI